MVFLLGWLLIDLQITCGTPALYRWTPTGSRAWEACSSTPLPASAGGPSSRGEEAVAAPPRRSVPILPSFPLAHPLSTLSPHLFPGWPWQALWRGSSGLPQHVRPLQARRERGAAGLHRRRRRRGQDAAGVAGRGEARDSDPAGGQVARQGGPGPAAASCDPGPRELFPNYPVLHPRAWHALRAVQSGEDGRAAKALSREENELVIQALVAEGALRLDFGFTAYATTAYLKVAAPRAAALLQAGRQLLISRPQAPAPGGGPPPQQQQQAQQQQRQQQQQPRRQQQEQEVIILTDSDDDFVKQQPKRKKP